jgi:hypothetical protein
MAQSAVKDFGKARSDAYVKGMEQINASNKALDLRPVAKAIEDGAGMVYYNGVAKSTEAADTIKKIVSKFEEFNALPPAAKNSPKGVDALKQAIGEIRQGTQHGTVSRTVANNVYNTAKEQIVKQLPEYAQTMKGYSQASEQLDDITKTLSLGERSAKDSGIRALTSAMRNNVSTNYGRRVQLVDELAKHQPELPYAIAGQSLSSPTARGLSRLPQGLTALAGASTFNPMVIPALAASSPRFMGEVAYGAGKAAGGVEKIAKALGVDVKTAAQIMRKSYAASQGTQPTLVGSQTGDYPAP